MLLSLRSLLLLLALLPLKHNAKGMRNVTFCFIVQSRLS